MTLVLIDNYDSFTYNLYQLIGSQSNEKIIVFRNDEISVNGITKINPKYLVFSPGPGNPRNKRDFGICTDLLKTYGKKIPILGICLGHQGIGYFFGAEIVSAKEIRHGKTSTIQHTGKGIFRNIPENFEAARYHSLAISSNKLPDELEILATSSDGEIMAIQHRDFMITGLQFHPESVLTNHGIDLIRNFLDSNN